MDQLYKSAIVSAHDSIHINSANRHQSEKKLSKIAAKTQAENAKVPLSLLSIFAFIRLANLT